MAAAPTKPHGYERFGLLANPFHELDSESQEITSLHHVMQAEDEALRAMMDEVLERQRKALVAVVGPLGAGKTQRLRWLECEARASGAYVVHLQLPTDAKGVLAELSKAMRQARQNKGLRKFWSGAPKWHKTLARIERRSRKNYDPERVGKSLSDVFAANVPAFLLLNDMQNLRNFEEASQFLNTLQALVTQTSPGVLVAFSCTAEYYDVFARAQPAITSRVHRVLHLQRLDDARAGLLLAKRLTVKRLVEDLDPLYPFIPEAIAEMNVRANGNARELLKAADHVLDAAAQRRVYQIDAEFVRSTLGRLAPPASAAPEPTPAAEPTPGVEVITYQEEESPVEQPAVRLTSGPGAFQEQPSP